MVKFIATIKEQLQPIKCFQSTRLTNYTNIFDYETVVVEEVKSKPSNVHIHV